MSQSSQILTHKFKGQSSNNISAISGKCIILIQERMITKSNPQNCTCHLFPQTTNVNNGKQEAKDFMESQIWKKKKNTETKENNYYVNQ